jgi:hypothetical protein
LTTGEAKEIMIGANTMKILLSFLIFTFSFITLACGGAENSGIGEPVEFQLYSGNESLAPPYQHILIIRGKINGDNIAITYSSRDKDGEVKRQVTFEGDKYRKYVEMVRNTRIKVVSPSEKSVGGGAFDVTLIDGKGKSVMGDPSNPNEWAQFEGDVSANAK